MENKDRIVREVSKEIEVAYDFKTKNHKIEEIGRKEKVEIPLSVRKKYGFDLKKQTYDVIIAIFAYSPEGKPTFIKTAIKDLNEEDKKELAKQIILYKYLAKAKKGVAIFVLEETPKELREIFEAEDYAFKDGKWVFEKSG